MRYRQCAKVLGCVGQRTSLLRTPIHCVGQRTSLLRTPIHCIHCSALLCADLIQCWPPLLLCSAARLIANQCNNGMSIQSAKTVRITQQVGPGTAHRYDDTVLAHIRTRWTQCLLLAPLLQHSVHQLHHQCVVHPQLAVFVLLCLQQVVVCWNRCDVERFGLLQLVPTRVLQARPAVWHQP